MTDESGDPLPGLDPESIVDLDVRGDLAEGNPPLGRVLRAAAALAPHQVLHLRSPFRPERLLGRLAREGYAWHTERFSEGDWSTWFWRRDASSVPGSRTSDAALTAVSDLVPEGVMDLRLLPPPEPILRVLERIEVDPGPFDILVPFYPEPLVRILEPTGRRIVLVQHRPDGVQVRIEPAS